MMKLILRVCLLAVLAAPLGVLAAFASGEDEEFDPVHHTADGYYLDFAPLGKIELPRLFIVRDAQGSLGLDVFGSTSAALRSGRYTAVLDEAHGAGEGTEEAAAQVIEQVPSFTALIESGGHLDAHLERVDGAVVLDFSITRHLVFALVSATLCLLLFISLARRYQRGVGRTEAPRGALQNLFEVLILFVRDDIAKQNIGDKYARFLPYLLTVFFFILFCNLLGLVPYGATATSNLMVTAVLATITFVLTQVYASRDHWAHVFWPPGVPTPIKPILIPVEILGLFTKPIALAIRLFANMTAGHLVILSLIGLIFMFGRLFGAGAGFGVAPVSVAFALFVSLLEILIAFIQAYIFTVLSALFIGMAVAEHHHEEAHGEAHAGQLAADHGHVTPAIIHDGAEAGREAAAVPVPAS